MRYINRLFTYLLTYLLKQRPSRYLFLVACVAMFLCCGVYLRTTWIAFLRFWTLCDRISEQRTIYASFARQSGDFLPIQPAFEAAVGGSSSE